MSSSKKICGATLERGKVVNIENGKYRVESLDRPELKGTPMSVFSGETLDVGDSVFFYLFADGDGIILCKR